MQTNKDINTDLNHIEVFFKERSEIYNKISELDLQKKKYLEQIKKLELNMYDSCVHEWLYDHNCAFDDPIKYYCKYCGLWRRRSLYLN